MGVPRAFNFSKELALPCDLKSVQVEKICESDLCTENGEADREVDDIDTVAQVLLSLNLEM